MNIDHKYIIHIYGYVPCGCDGFKTEKELIKSFENADAYIEDVLSEEFGCQSVYVEVKEVK